MINKITIRTYAILKEGEREGEREGVKYERQKLKSKTSVLRIHHCRNESEALSKLFRQLDSVIVECVG